MTIDTGGAPLPRDVDAVLRDFTNAVAKAGMYPAGHRYVVQSAAALSERLAAMFAVRDAVTIGVTPAGLLLDGVTVTGLPGPLRDFARRLHTKNIGSIQLRRGVSGEEIAAMLSAIADSDAEEQVGRSGLRLERARIEPMVYDALAFADPAASQQLDDAFWRQLVEAASDHSTEAVAEIAGAQELARALAERASGSADGAAKVYEALNALVASIASRAGAGHGSASEQLVEVLSSLTRPATTRVVAAAPSRANRRRFLRDTLQVVPPALLLQLLESVAEADGETLSPQLRWLLTKLAAGEGSGDVPVDGAFASGVLGLVQLWDGDEAATDMTVGDARVVVAPFLAVLLGLQTGVVTPAVIDGARSMIAGDMVAALMQLLDDERYDIAARQAVADAVFDSAMLQHVLDAPLRDFTLIERVAARLGAASVDRLLDALGSADDRATRRRLLDVLVRVGPIAEATLLSRLHGAPWYLARNILAVLQNYPQINDYAPIFAALAQPEIRVRQEALKTLVRHSASRDRALASAIDSNEPALQRIALTAMAAECPPRMAAAIARQLPAFETELQLLAVRALGSCDTAAVAPALVAIATTTGGFFRRTRLAPKSPLLLAALEVLASRWAVHPASARALALARNASDADIRSAASA